MIVDKIITVQLIVAKRPQGPSVELRRVATDPDLIKFLVSSAYHGKSVIIKPQFSNRLDTLNTLVRNGIISHENGRFVFNI